MAAIPANDRDPTLDAADLAIEGLGNAEPSRPYLGMSEIGRPCTRALWYGFRWCSPKSFDAAALKRFEDGHMGEDLQAERLRRVPGITLYTTDPRTPGKQFGFADLGGHFRGHMDGVILGLLQAPKRWHVWEHKQVDEAKQTKLVNVTNKQGEKLALREWDEVYHVQAQLYMHYSGMERHYLTCSLPGGRKTVSARTEYAKQKAEAAIDKARRIIQSPEPLARISERPDWYQCRWCEHHAICHERAIPKANCRTCAHVTPEMDGNGRWSCARFGCDLDVETQRQGGQCPAHLFIPALMPWKAVDANGEENWVEYEKPNGTRIRNGSGGYASRELAANAAICGEPFVEETRQKMGAEVVG